MNINISIIITFYQGISILQTCLKNLINTLPKQEFYGDLEVIIVNDNPSISLQNIQDEFKPYLDLRIINMPYNQGYSASCNQGVEHSKYDTIILMDCDIMPYDKWLFYMLKSYVAIDKKGTISATIMNMSDNTLVSYGVCIYGVDILLLKHNSYRDIYTSIDRDYPFVTSGCLLISKELYLALGGQEECMINAYNDFDLTYKIYKMGYLNRICSKAIVYHRGSVSGKIRHLPFKTDAKALLFQRWGKELQIPTPNILSQLYSLYNWLNNKNVIIINFSTSVNAKFYINLFCECHNLTIVQEYTYKNINLDNIIVNDYLSWEVCRTNIPILYFVDQYTMLINNYYWFMNRANENDIILDAHANIYHSQNLFKN